MTTMTSAWMTGTYDLLVAPDRQGRTGDLLVTVFAKPADEEDTVANEDAPVLGQVEIAREEYDQPLQDYQYVLTSIGERGLIQPEQLEKLYGPKLAVRILLALYQAAERDFYGTDMEFRPWREPQELTAFPIMQRTHTLLMDLKARLF